MYFQDASHLKDKVLVKPDDFTEEFWSLFVRGSTFHLFKVQNNEPYRGKIYHIYSSLGFAGHS